MCPPSRSLSRSPRDPPVPPTTSPEKHHDQVFLPRPRGRGVPRPRRFGERGQPRSHRQPPPLPLLRQQPRRDLHDHRHEHEQRQHAALVRPAPGRHGRRGIRLHRRRQLPRVQPHATSHPERHDHGHVEPRQPELVGRLRLRVRQEPDHGQGDQVRLARR